MTDEYRINPHKRIDEAWKEAVAREKESTSAASGPAASKDAGPESGPGSGVDFSVLISTLGMQALAALGELPDGAGQKGEPQLDQARYMIELLGILEKKTKGNLTSAEADALGRLLYELRVKFVAASRGEGEPS